MRLNELFVLDRNDPKIIQKINNDDYVTEADIEDIYSFYGNTMLCRGKFRENLAEANTYYGGIYDSYHTDLDYTVSKVVKREITNGEANKTFIESSISFKPQLSKSLTVLVQNWARHIKKRFTEESWRVRPF